MPSSALYQKFAFRPDLSKAEKVNLSRCDITRHVPEGDKQRCIRVRKNTVVRATARPEKSSNWNSMENDLVNNDLKLPFVG